MVKEKSFLRRFWKPILLAALILALVLTAVGLNSSSREAKSLREQVERQNELIKIEYEKSQRENKDLKAENEKLKKALKKKEVAFIKGL